MERIKLVASLWRGFSFFLHEQRRVDEMIDNLNKEANSLKNDWVNVGEDLKKALPKAKPTKEKLESMPQLCHA